MKIFGIGTDIVNIKRIKETIKNNSSFKQKIFSKKEILYCENRKNSAAFYAKRFAAKEALSKALGTGIRKDVKFKDMEILNDKLGKPYIKLKGTTESFLKKKVKKKYFIYLSLSDDNPWAQATVVISYK
jgi:holo-[acyl-carrier protein] synthase